MKFIDIHCHLAWGVDDGMDTKEHALQALSMASEDGICELIATPHLVPGEHDVHHMQTLRKRIAELNRLASDFNIQVHTGCELFLNDSYYDFIDQKELLTLANGPYLLCEFNVLEDIETNDDAENKLYEISVNNRIPVIAHVERYFHSTIDLKRVQAWIDQGYVIQVNRSSLLGIYGKMAKKNAYALLEHGMVHVVASDAHRYKGSRIPKLSDAYDILVSLVGQENAELLLYINPKHIIEQESVQKMNVQTKKPWRFRLLRR